MPYIAKRQFGVGFALSGGFIKGFAHLGMMQALFEHDIRPDIIAGVSAGALAGAFIADGKEPYRVVEIFQQHTFGQLTSFARSVSGLLKMDDLVDFLHANISVKRIEELGLPLVVVASDLDNGGSVQFRQGDLAKCIAASCCMPVLFAPVIIDGVHYVDGGVFMNLPVSPIRGECDRVLAINVSPINATTYKKNVLSIAVRCFNYMFRANSLHDKLLADMLLEAYNLDSFSNTEFEKAGEIFEAGYRQANVQLKSKLKEW